MLHPIDLSKILHLALPKRYISESCVKFIERLSLKSTIYKSRQVANGGMGLTVESKFSLLAQRAKLDGAILGKKFKLKIIWM